MLDIEDYLKPGYLVLGVSAASVRRFADCFVPALWCCWREETLRSWRNWARN